MLRHVTYSIQKILLREKKLTSLSSSFYVNLSTFNKYSTNEDQRKVKAESEKDIPVYMSKDTEDVFGTLSSAAKDIVYQEELDEADKKEEKYLENYSAKPSALTTKQYADIIKSYIHKRQIKEAIDVLEVKMIKEDRVKPENYIYNLLLGACGRVGYTKKAFKLYNDMKKRGLKPTGGTYTALFNACSNSPWPDDGLIRASKLRQQMIENGVIANDTNYNVMIKAFGRCGDMNTAFALADEMVTNKILISEATINFLLQTCINNKENGYVHALLVWRKFNKLIKPDIFSFNLMLRCIRDCDLGDPEIAKQLLLPVSPTAESKKIVDKTNDQKLLKDNKEKLALVCIENMIDLSEVKTPDQRLLLLGGFSKFLDDMRNFNVPPDIKTFSLLLDDIPSTLAAEKSLLAAMKREKIKPDIDFLNMLIKKRSMRFDYVSAKEVLDLFETFKLRPDIITYGVLALGCEIKEDANNLIKSMQDNGYRINIEILGTLLKQACIKENFVYVLEVMELVIQENIHPNKIFLEHLETFHKTCMEQAKNEVKRGQFWKKGFHIFRMRYKQWLEKVKVDTSEDQHPWQQFRNPVETKVKHYKDKQVHFKPRITSRYKEKTGSLA